MDKLTGYFGQQLTWMETVKPAWDRICSKIDTFMEGKAIDEDGEWLSGEIPGDVYDWEVYIAKFNGNPETARRRLYPPSDQAFVLVSPWGHQITEGWEVELWLTGQGGRRPLNDKPGFSDDAKVQIICTDEGVYHGHSGELLTVEELQAFEIDLDAVIGMGSAS